MQTPPSQGSLTITALLVLVGVAVLGVSMGWMQLRSIDTASEWLNQPTFARRSMTRLLELGQRVVLDRFDERCLLPAAADFQLELLPWGSVSASFHPPASASGPFPVTLTAVQGEATRQLACQVNCALCYEWLTPGQCGTEGGRTFSMICS
ncbi:MAG: hypothetical protein H7837_10615 [Magnetococcus sp. MYC-9]